MRASGGVNNVAVFSLNATTDGLTPVPGSPFASGLKPDPLAIAPPPLAGISGTGKFVFVANTGDNSLSACSIDSTGTLTPVTGSPIPLGSTSQPSSLPVDPGGKFVYVSISPQQNSRIRSGCKHGNTDAYHGLVVFSRGCRG